MTDFLPPTQINDVEKPSVALRTYVTPAITFASADEGPKGKFSSHIEDAFVGPS